MEKSSTLTVDRVRVPLILIFFSGIGMMAASILTIQHFFLANYPESIFEGSFCDISAFFNCDSSAFSSISQLMGIPLGFFGLIVGALVALGTLFPSESFERTNTFIALFNGLGVIGLFLYSVLVMKSLCLLCTGYYLFALLSLVLFWRYGVGRGQKLSRYFHPSLKMLVTFACITALGAYGMILYHDAKRDAQTGVVTQIVKQFYELPVVGDPSFISPYWTARSTENFEDTPIRVIEYVDFLCPDCLFSTQQLNRLKEEFAGKINIAFQFFPLEGECNTVVNKNLHPGACELSYLAAYDPANFLAIHDEIFANFNAARNPGWRQELAIKYGVEEALNDPYTHDLIQRIIETGIEYEKTSERFDSGIRSTPTMIINGRMVIGTLPYQQMHAIFQALVEESEGGRTFIENWVPPKARKKGR
ncbi:MAG: thioredoxin domain-containing protein [Candidatus Aminicenantes bacterium]|nr:thioredoxin domain-containing protein [Candidatus Aminicenantes bacterium]